jgi:hypothetical protein
MERGKGGRAGSQYPVQIALARGDRVVDPPPGPAAHPLQGLDGNARTLGQLLQKIKGSVARNGYF